MEIKDQLGVIWHRLWIVILVPLIAAAAVAGLSLRGPTEYRSTATVAVPGVVSGADAQYGGTSGNRAFVSNYLAVVGSLSVAQRVATETNVPLSEVRDGLRFSPVGDSSVVKVSYRSQHKDQAERVARAAATQALTAVFQPGVEDAKRILDSSKQAATNAQAAIDGFVSETGLVDPDRAYQVKAEQVANLEQQAAASQATGPDSGLAVINTALTNAKKELAALTPQLTTYRSLVEAKNQALNHLDQSENQLVSASTPDEIVRLQQVVKEAREAVDEAQRPIDAFIARTGLVDPERSYQLKQQQISTLEQQLVTSQVRSQPAAQPQALTAAVATAKQELVALTPLVSRYKALIDDRDRTKAPLEQAEKQLEAAVSRLGAGNTGSAVSISPVAEVAYVRATAMKAGAAAAGALFLVILALFALNSGIQRPTSRIEPGQPVAVAVGR